MAWSTPKTWTVSEVLTAANLNTYIRDNQNILKTSIADDGSLEVVLVSRTTSDFIKNANTTLGDVTGLSFAIAASEVFAFVISVQGVSNATADWKFAITVPTGATGRYGINAQAGAFSDTIGNNIAPASTGSDEHLIISGTVANSSNAGTVQLQAAQNASHASNTTIYTNSHIRAFRI